MYAEWRLAKCISQFQYDYNFVELKGSEPNKIAKKVAPYIPEVIPYLVEALQLGENNDPSQIQYLSVSKMISLWNEKLVKSDSMHTIEPKRILARKLVEVGAKFSTSLDDGHKGMAAMSTFETLAKDLDVHGKYIRLINYVLTMFSLTAPSIKQLQVMAPQLTEQGKFLHLKCVNGCKILIITMEWIK